MNNEATNNSDFAFDMVRGLVYNHNRANANTAEVHETSALLQAVVELLVERGVLDAGILEERQQAVADKLRRKYVERGMAVAMQEFKSSKYEFQGSAEVDCANRVHLCKAACCRLPLALSKEDVQEGVVRWDLGRPYMIAHGKAGYCVHLDQKGLCCSVYDQRPIPCRGYDCRKDKRIWLDFENKVINSRIDEPAWPESLERDTSPWAEGHGEFA